eukprot:365778-Chlamydomonas_euryale.AAC.19
MKDDILGVTLVAPWHMWGNRDNRAVAMWLSFACMTCDPPLSLPHSSCCSAARPTFSASNDRVLPTFLITSRSRPLALCATRAAVARLAHTSTLNP